jgi:uncharacterized Fe-S cluster-containing radical SAM superfamily protein
MAECLVRDGSMSEFLDRLHPAERRIPLFGTLEITFRCNLTCAHCYVNRGRNDTAEIERELPLDRHLQLMDEYAAAGCLSLLLTGGEPLLRPDFLDLYRAAVVRGFRVSVFTNATLIDGSILRLFQKYPPAAVEVTLYGRTPETYERITGVPGSFERCRAGIEQLRVGGVRLKLKTMVMQWNEHEIEAIRRYAGELGISFRHDGLLNSRFDCWQPIFPILLSAGDGSPRLKPCWEREQLPHLATSCIRAVGGTIPSRWIHTGTFCFACCPDAQLSICGINPSGEGGKNSCLRSGHADGNRNRLAGSAPCCRSARIVQVWPKSSREIRKRRSRPAAG